VANKQNGRVGPTADQTPKNPSDLEELMGSLEYKAPGPNPKHEVQKYPLHPETSNLEQTESQNPERAEVLPRPEGYEFVPGKDRAFVPEGMGSTTMVNLDGKSELGGYVTETGITQRQTIEEMSMDYSPRGAPWGLEPSLEEMATEVGIVFDHLIDGFAKDRGDAEMAREFGVSEKTVAWLRERFIRYGIDSMQGQD